MKNCRQRQKPPSTGIEPRTLWADRDALRTNSSNARAEMYVPQTGSAEDQVPGARVSTAPNLGSGYTYRALLPEDRQR